MTMTMDEIKRVLREAHVTWLLQSPWGLAIARNRAKSCTIRPEETRPAYAALVEKMERGDVPPG